MAILGLEGYAVGVCRAVCLSRTNRDAARAALVFGRVIHTVLYVANYALDEFGHITGATASILFH